VTTENLGPRHVRVQASRIGEHDHDASSARVLQFPPSSWECRRPLRVGFEHVTCRRLELGRWIWLSLSLSGLWSPPTAASATTGLRSADEAGRERLPVGNRRAPGLDTQGHVHSRAATKIPLIHFYGTEYTNLFLLHSTE
jgi:hypothetical protein